MIKQLTLQKAIFTLANINKELERFNRRFYANFFGPVAIDGKPIANSNKAQANETDVNQYQELINDASNLRQTIAQANNDTQVNGQTMTYQLEWLRQTRNLITQLERVLERQEVRVENGVGVVEYNAYSEPFVQDTLTKLTKAVNQLSTQIDQVNAQTMLTVELVTDI